LLLLPPPPAPNGLHPLSSATGKSLKARARERQRGMERERESGESRAQKKKSLQRKRFKCVNCNTPGFTTVAFGCWAGLGWAGYSGSWLLAKLLSPTSSL